MQIRRATPRDADAIAKLAAQAAAEEGGVSGLDVDRLKAHAFGSSALVEAWVAERNSWVHRRGQYLVDAQLLVWPGPVPSGDEADRIEQGGQFNVLFGDPDE